MGNNHGERRTVVRVSLVVIGLVAAWGIVAPVGSAVGLVQTLHPVVDAVSNVLDPVAPDAPLPISVPDVLPSAPDASVPDASKAAPAPDPNLGASALPAAPVDVPSLEAPAAAPLPAVLPLAAVLPSVDLPAPPDNAVVEDVPHETLGHVGSGAAAGSAAGGSATGVAPSLGSQTVAADMGAQDGIGPSLQRSAGDFLAGPGSWYASLPEEARQATDALLGILLSGLAIAGAYVMGFRHIDKENLLEHNTRAELLNLVRERPGVHLREVARRMTMTTTNAGYHLRVLERHGLVRSERLNGKRVYMPAGGKDANQRNVALALLRRDSRAQVAVALQERPGINQLGLAQKTGQHQGAVGWHLHRLMEAGVVSEERTPRECRYHLTPLGIELVASCKPEAPALAHAAYARPPAAATEPVP